MLFTGFFCALAAQVGVYCNDYYALRSIAGAPSEANIRAQGHPIAIHAGSAHPAAFDAASYADCLRRVTEATTDQRFPAAFLAYVRDVTIFFDEEMPDAIGYATGAHIAVYCPSLTAMPDDFDRGFSIKMTFAHELGHIVERNIYGDFGVAFSDLQTKNPDDYVFDMVHADAAEDFANTFAYYYFGGDFLKNPWPLTPVLAEKLGRVAYSKNRPRLRGHVCLHLQ